MKKNLMAGLLAGILLVSLPPSVRAVQAAETEKDISIVETEASENKVVRVGYFPSVNFQEGGPEEQKRGAGYEYLQKISYITGWEYEYVYGSFKECMNMIKDGEIDLLGDVAYIPEREAYFDYSSYTQGKEKYWIYTDEEHADLADGDMQKLNGCSICVVDGSHQKTILREWLDRNNIKAQVVPCKSYIEMSAKMSADQVEAVVIPRLSAKSDSIPVAYIGSDECYFGVSKFRPDILEELNAALEEINNVEFDYSGRLYARYEESSAVNNALNVEEKQWLEAHENTIRVGYLEDNLPFCSGKSGKLTGILGTVLDTVSQRYGITVKSTPYITGEQLNEALQAGEIDIAGPVIQNFDVQEEFSIVSTDDIFNITPVVIYRGNDYNKSLEIIATTETSVYSKIMVSLLFPEAEIRQYDTQEDCLRAVDDGEAGCTIIPSSRINILNVNPLMKNLSFAEMAKRQDLVMLAAKENRRAATIVNKGIMQSSDLLNGVVLAQNSVADQKLIIKELIGRYLWLLQGIALLIILILLLLLKHFVDSKKKLTAALEETKKANSANVAKTTFLNNMSHDMRTPMNAIIGFTNIAMKMKTNEEMQNCLGKIRQSSEYLMSLINDVLDISRIESGKLEYKPMPIKLTEVTDTVIAIAKGYIENRDLEFSVSRQTLENPYVMADELRIRDVLLNLISNAVKFTKDGGRIVFKAENYPGDDSQHIVVCYQVSDNGIGMSEEFQSRLYEEFAQEREWARTSYKGTGLGLAITKRYVDLMGGTIEVQSTKGVGSTFTVKIPLLLAENVAVKKDEADSAQYDLNGTHILLAEDNDLNAEIAITMLEEMGIQAVRVADGKAAVETFRNNPKGSFDVILMDIMMPEMNGYEATRAIRSLEERPDGKTIPIIAMTANAFAEDVQASLDAGMNRHLAKPINMDTVKKTIAEVLADTR